MLFLAYALWDPSSPGPRIIDRADTALFSCLTVMGLRGKSVNELLLFPVLRKLTLGKYQYKNHSTTSLIKSKRKLYAKSVFTN